MTERKKMKGERTIEIGGEDWGWKVGKSNVVIVRPDGKKYVVPRNLTDETLETACECCGEPDGGEIGVTLPGSVAKYIRNHLLRDWR
jgi:hypothetical protein